MKRLALHFALAVLPLLAPPIEPVPADLCLYAPSGDYLVCGEFLVCPDGARKQPRWSLELITKDSLSGTAKRLDREFRADERLPREFDWQPRDYLMSGYDRGHIAAAANHTSSDAAIEATFSVVNCSPQTPNLNRVVWLKLEAYIREIVCREDIKRVWIVTAPAWIPPDPHLERGGRVATLTVRYIGRSQIPVPTHFGKTILIEHDSGTLEMRSWLIANREDVSANLEDHACSTDRLESAIGLDVWAALPDEMEEKLEAATF